MRGDLRLAGVIGFPVGHSLSPRLHEFWLAQHGIAGHYIPIEAAPEDFAKTVAVLQRAGFAGLNVTMPHKEAAYTLAHKSDTASRIVGAANLLLFGDDHIEARNTDVAALRESLIDEFGEELNGSVAVLLGAGGAARAAVLALEGLGFREVRILSRNCTRGQCLIADLQRHVSAELTSLDWTQWDTALADSNLLVNATSAGMRNAQPLTFSLESLPKGAAVYDVVYNPVETALVKHARARGHPAAGGLGMLIHQAVPAYHSFFGARPSDLRGARAELEKILAQ